MEKNSKVNRTGTEDQPLKGDQYKEAENLGLDADHSSENSRYGYLNNDNDRISHNPDGESDDSDDDQFFGHSPLMDK